MILKSSPLSIYALAHAGCTMERKIKINRLDLIKAKAQNDLIYNNLQMFRETN